MMQIITGKYKNLKIKSLDSIRSTKSIVRHAIFNILGAEIVNSSFLDIFAGTGIIGIEALSRGARNVIINDIEKKHYNLMKKNCLFLDLEDQEKIQVYSKDALQLKTNFNKIDIVFADAPYEEIGININLIKHIKLNKGSLKKILYICESNKEESNFLNDHIENGIKNLGLECADMTNLHNEFAINAGEPRRYGKTFLQFLEI